MQSEDRRQLDLAWDPLLCRLKLPFRSVFYPLGFPAVLETNSSDVVDAIERSWGRFQMAYDTDPVHLCVVVDSDPSEEPLPTPVFHCRRHLLSVVAGQRNYATCDLSAGFTSAWITADAAKDWLYLRDAFTDAPVYSMLHSRHLAAVHAACVTFQGAGLLLCGDSGAGKTSLAVACALNGWGFLSDDATYLIRAAGGHSVIGNPYELRFKRDARNLFPQLAERSASLRLNGKATIFVGPEDLPGVRTELCAEARYLVFLQRTDGAAPALCPVRDGVEQRLRVPLYGEDRVIAEQQACLRNLADLPAYGFTYSDLPSAVEYLQKAIQAGGLP